MMEGGKLFISYLWMLYFVKSEHRHVYTINMKVYMTGPSEYVITVLNLMIKEKLTLMTWDLQ